MSQYKKDLISSFLFLVFGALVVAAVPLTIKDPKISVMGPRVFPYFIGICMILLSLALLAVTLVKHYKENVGETAAKERSPEVRRAALRDELRAVALAAIILLYSAFFATLGYFVSTLAVSTAILLLFRVRKIWAYPVVYVVTVVVWAALTFLLSVRLP